jgi:hypothetical protein
VSELFLLIESLYVGGPQQENEVFLWQEHALTASAASSDVFAVRHAQNELRTEPVGARWLEKVM